MTDLSGLLERVKKATGPDRELDRDLGLAIGGWTLGLEPGFEQYGEMLKVPGDGTYVNTPDGGTYPSFVESVDAALGLVERVLPGCTDTSDASYPEAGIDWTLFPNGEGDGIRGTARTRPLAILAAFLIALIANPDLARVKP